MKGVCRTNQLKRRLILHSWLYYIMNESLISDTQWDKEALELANRIAKGLDTDLHKDLFKDWDGSTGYHLANQCDRLKIQSLAQRLLEYHNALYNKEKG